MLLECPGKTIRLFIAEPGHLLNGNAPNRFKRGQSVSFHAHHCELTLVPLFGRVINWRVEKDEHGSIEADEFQYQSAITHGKIGFSKIGKQRLRTFSFEPLSEDVFMRAQDIHTIVAPEGKWAAWFALEGRENPEHDNHCFSMTDVSKEDFSGFYKPVSESELNRLLSAIGVKSE